MMSDNNYNNYNTFDKDEALRIHTPEDHETETLGSMLSHTLKSSTPCGPCLSDEDIANLIESTIEPGEKDRMMKHLASCPTCCEVYSTACKLFSAEANEDVNAVNTFNTEDIEKRKFMIRVNEEELTGELTKERHRPFWRSKGLAIAASLFIVVVSLVIFYQTSEIPKSSQELMSMKVPPMEKEETAMDESVSPVKDGDTATAPEQLETDKPLSGVQPDKEKKTDQNVPSVVIPEPNKSNEKKTNGNQKDSGGSRSSADAYAVQMNESNVKEREVKEKKITLPAAPPVITAISNHTQNQSPGSVQQQRKGIAQTQSESLENQFKRVYEGSGTMRFAAKVSEETAVSKKEESKNSKDSKESDKDYNAYPRNAMEMQGVEPTWNEMTTVENNGTKIPNMVYFLSKSPQGSVEYRFFSLAQWGWCDKNKHFHRMEYFEQIRGLRSENTGNDRLMKEDLLKKWEALLPELKGIYREIAEFTIAYLKTNSK